MREGQFAVLKTILTCVRKNAIRCAMDIIDYQGVLSAEPDYLSVATDKTEQCFVFSRDDSGRVDDCNSGRTIVDCIVRQQNT